MKHFIPIAEIRCGEFVTQLGFLSIGRVGGHVLRLADSPKTKDDPADPNNDMPIIAWSWRGSDYPPAFQSLN